ncbi:Type III secretion basal body protein I, YscI, HrpB, PscI [Duganella sp. CF458]|nr:Type III secretion basal body protein I, YscI, HrpB, PscI [Duganella sp. CF458]
MAVQGAASGLAGKPVPQVHDPAAAGEGAASFKVQLQVQQQQFHSGAQQDLAPAPVGKDSLAAVMAERAAGLAGDVNRHQQYVSRMLERATASGDSLHLMHAMLALNDYQLRVQTISKVVSRAGSSIDSLTKLQ